MKKVNVFLILGIPRLWSKPRYSKNEKDIDFLHKISNFPIRELHTSDFSCNWLEILGLVPQLRLLHVDTAYYNYHEPEKVYLRFLKVPVIVHTKALEIWDNFEQLLDLLCSIKVKELVIDHEPSFHSSHNRQRNLSIEELKQLASKVVITEVHTNCIEWDSETILDLIKLLSSLKNCRVLLYNHDHLSASLYTVKYLELMVKSGIKIVYIESEGLNLENCQVLSGYVNVMKKMNYLEEFRFHDKDFKTEFKPIIRSLIDLPIKTISTSFFKHEDGKIGEVVNILSRMKLLNDVIINPDQETDYKLSPEELSLFKDLPVTEVFLDVLNLAPHNIPAFRQVMREMKIQHIFWIEGYFEALGFEVSIHDFIDESNGYVYKTI